MIKPSFENSLSELEEVVKKLEDGDLGLEKSIEEFEKGIKLIKECQKLLDKAEQKVSILLSNSSGEVTAEPFEGEEK